MIFIDSNIWIYYLSEKSPEHKFVKEPFRKIILTEEIVSNVVVILEVAHYFRLLPKSDLEKLIDYITGLSNIRIIDLDRKLMRNSLKFLLEYARLGIGSRDAAILATMDATETNKIVTHDRVFKSLKFLNVIDPVS